MTDGLINPADPPERQREKLLTILDVLMRRVEQTTDASGAAYAQFERAAMLEDQVRERTRDLERALDLLNQSNAQLAGAMREADAARRNLSDAIETVQEGFALFDPFDVLVMCNSRFGMHMSDIRPHLRPGLGFAGYVELVSQSRHLSLPQGDTPEGWAVARMRRHQDRHVIFNVQMDGDRWVQVSEHRTGDGGTVILQTDVTDIIRAERLERGKLLDDQARIVRATLDHISQGVCIFDSEGRLLGWNNRAADLLAVPLARFRLGMQFDELVARLQDDLSLGAGASLADLRAWVRRHAPHAALRFQVQRGEALILAAFAQGMPDGGFVISFTDISAERRAIAALSRANETLEARVAARTLELADALAQAERANAARSRFVAAASHDLLQPLSAARLFLASVSDEAMPPRAGDALAKAGAALDSVETILEALLDISRLESGRASVTMAPVALGPMLARLADEFAAPARDKGLALRVRPTQAVVLSDATYLRRILQNLIGNAVRYTARGGVLVGVRAAGAHAAVVEVIDTGPGIPEDEQENIFREFHRLNARASASEGLGLGLAIVERAAGLLGHPLHLCSRVGQGTRFRLRLGRAEAPTEARPALPQVAAPIGDLVGLLVEPDTDLRGALVHLLEGRGIAVLEADSAETALALLAELGILPDFVLADGAGDGQAALAAWAQLRHRLDGIPALVLSPDRGAGFRAATAALGAGVLAKPLAPAALDRFLARVAGGG